MTPLLQTQTLELSYGQVPACREISITVNEGEIVTLIGANGAGKTTTLRAVAGALRPRSGTIRFAGADITASPSHERTNLGIALVPEGRRVFPFLTVRENLELGAFKYRKEHARVRGRMEAMFDMFPRLRDRAVQNAGTLSGGEQQMLALARAMMSERTRHRRAVGRTERTLRAADRYPRLCAADGLDHDQRSVQRTA
jgi:branched-chain amino acid transport system ATP-binding protein